MEEEIKKPFYKRWWFWLIIIIVLFAIFSNNDDVEPEINDGDNETIDLETDDSIEDDTTTDEEETIIDDVDEETEEETPDQQADQGEEISAGTYKIGDDLEAGEYLVFSDELTYIESSSDSTGELDSIIFNANLMNDAHTYVTLNDGEYFKLQGGTMYPADSAPSIRPDDGVYRDGMYKVGVDIEPGEYRVTLNDDAPAGMGYLEVSSDSSHRLDSIVTNENVQADTYITVSEGQYLTISNLTIE